MLAALLYASHMKGDDNGMSQNIIKLDIRLLVTKHRVCLASVVA